MNISEKFTHTQKKFRMAQGYPFFRKLLLEFWNTKSYSNLMNPTLYYSHTFGFSISFSQSLGYVLDDDQVDLGQLHYWANSGRKSIAPYKADYDDCREQIIDELQRKP